MVMGALVFGRGREQAGVLLEPRPGYTIDPKDEAAVVAFRNKVWCVISACNTCLVSHGYIQANCGTG